MKTMIAVALFVTPLLLGGCGKKDDAADGVAPNGFTPPQTRAPTPIPGQAQTTPITAYVGKYPHDAVDGVGFFDRTEVATGLVEAIGDAKMRETIRGRTGPATPIFTIKRRDGMRIAAWGCEQHNCSDRNWTVLVDPKGSKTQVCYHDADTMGAQSEWYAGGAPQRRADPCPSEG
ncbi:hypothetical protein U1707_12495 [Sphingomonas sp. PB2P12]|uniref:hypothetical protein n=1 Tax=Sphingomonas sandaracina TaxID=3096157 RepID=UPI002FCADE1E